MHFPATCTWNQFQSLYPFLKLFNRWILTIAHTLPYEHSSGEQLRSHKELDLVEMNLSNAQGKVPTPNTKGTLPESVVKPKSQLSSYSLSQGYTVHSFSRISASQTQTILFLLMDVVN